MSGVPNELIKDLFKNCSCGLKYYCVNNDGTIEFSHNIDVDEIAITKNGNVFVRWHNNAYDDMSSRIDDIDCSESHTIYGVFSNDSNASNAAKARHMQLLNEKRNELKQQLKSVEDELRGMSNAT